MRKLLNILKGWFIFIFKKRSVMANQRLKICFQCPFRKGIFCGECGCELHAKAGLEDEYCPKGKWGVENQI